MARPTRIPTDELTRVSRVLFDKTQFSGQQIARELGVNQNTLWGMFNRRGLPVEHADAVADLLTEWATKMLALASSLRQAAAANRPAPRLTGIPASAARALFRRPPLRRARRKPSAKGRK